MAGGWSWGGKRPLSLLRPLLQKTSTVQGKPHAAPEWLYLLLVFIIGTSYTYGVLMNYTLYIAVVDARHESEAPTSLVVGCMSFSKIIAQVSHAIAPKISHGELRETQMMMLALFGLATAGLFAASRTGTAETSVLVGVCTLNVISSRVVGSTLFATPSEDGVRSRIFVYDFAAQFGVFWLFVVKQILSWAEGSDAMRFIALATPLFVTLTAWLLVPASGHFSPARMAEAERTTKSRKAVAQAEEGKGASVALGAVSGSSELADAVDISRPWANARFRIIAATWCLNWWSFNFYAYNIFPTLISENGPGLEIVSVLYTVEGIVSAITIRCIIPWMKKRFMCKFFLATWFLPMLPPLAICLVGRLHWSGYVVVLFVMDIVCATSNLTLGSVLLHCLPWSLTPVFFSQVSAVGGFLSACSFIQLSLSKLLGWCCTSLLGHSAALCCVFAIYSTDPSAVRDLWKLHVRQQHGQKE